MLIRRDDLCHVNSVTHEGKVVVVATDKEGKLWYIVKQDGFEDSYLTQNPDERTGWENWQELPLPNEEHDQSVIDREKLENTSKDDSRQYLIRSRYDSNASAVAPVQMVSTLGHLYVFRQSRTNTLWMNRFVLDGLTNTLGRKIEVRFKRSREKYKAINSERSDKSLAIDSVDYTDINGNRFYEPTIELSLIKNLYNGWFSVVQLPTNEQDRYRWHIFTYNSESKRVELTSLLGSEDGLFQIKDLTIVHPELKTIPTVVRTNLDLAGDTVAHGISATRYDVQRERETEDGPQLLKESVRVMLLLGMMDGNVKALDFACAADGTLSRLSDNTGKSAIWRSDTQHIMLPLDTLDEVQAIGTTEPPPDGIVKGLNRGEKDSVIVESAGSTGISDTELTRVKIHGNPDINELYANISKVVDENTFDVKRAIEDSGAWEVIPEQQSGLIFNGAVTSYRVMANGDLRVSASNHGLTKGDSVQVVDTQSYNGTYSVTPINNKTFVLDGVRWQPGTIISARIASSKRRGVLLGNDAGHIRIPTHAGLGESLSIALWLKGSEEAWPISNQLVSKANSYSLQCVENSKSFIFTLDTEHGEHNLQFTPSGKITEWTHIAATYDGRQMSVYINGVLEGVQDCKGRIGEADDDIILGGAVVGPDWDHQLAELSLWSVVHSESDIRDSQYIPVKGNERHLIGYWPLSSIIEGSTRTTVDLSRHGRDGVVLGGAFIGSVELYRNLHQSEIKAVKYINSELIAVSERATYLEQFEFKTDTRTRWDEATIAPFGITCAGKRSRHSQDWTNLEVEATQIEFVNHGWHLASVQYTVPDGVSLIRSFGIENLAGDWQSLKIRKHQIAGISDRVSQLSFDESIPFLRELGSSSSQAQEPLAVVRRLEPVQVHLQTEQRRLTLMIAELKEFQTNRTAAIEKNKDDQKRFTKLIDATKKELKTAENLEIKWSDAIKKGSKKVKFYYNNDYKGDSFERNIGRYSSMPSGWNDELASIYVPEELQLVLYPHTNFAGRSMAFNTSHNLHRWDIPGTSTNWKNEASSYVVRTKGELYEDLDELKKKKKDATLSVASIKKTLNNRENNLAALKRMSVDRDVSEELRLAQKNKKITDDQLAEANSALEKANGDFDALRITPEAMPMQQINDSDPVLVTRGADLKFIRLGSKINALESCLGQVQLDYLDKSGCVKQVKYDATADTENTSFEQWLTNDERHCLYLNRTSALVELDTSTPALHEWTIEAWIYYTNVDERTWLALAHGSSPNEYPIAVQSKNGTDELGVYVNSKFSPCGFDMRSLSSGWHHIACVATGSSVKGSQRFFIDGKQVGESVPVRSTGGISHIGNKHGQQYYFGRIAEFRLWDEALSVEEIQANSQLTLTGMEPGLILYLPFDEGGGNQAHDKTGNYKANITSAHWWAFTGQIGKTSRHALTTDESSGYAQFPFSVQNNPDEFTVSCWAKCTGGEGRWRSPLTSRHSPAQGFMFYAGTDNRWQFWVGDGRSWQTATARRSN